MTKKDETINSKSQYDSDRVIISKDGIVSLNLKNKTVRKNIREKAESLKYFKVASN